jgi:hypothetical protein
VDLDRLSVGDRIVAGGSILLFLLLLIAPWHSRDLAAYGMGTVTAKATSSDGGAVAWPAYLVIVLLIALVAVVLLRRLTDVTLPELPIPWKQAIFYTTLAVPGLLLLKLVLKGDFIAFWAYIDILLGVGIAYGGLLLFQEPDA